MDTIHLIVSTWAECMESGDATSMEELLYRDFRSAESADKRAYLSSFAESAQRIERIGLQDAYHFVKDGRARVSPIVIEPKELSSYRVALILVEEMGTWQIASLELIDPDVRDVTASDSRDFHTISVRVRDDDTNEGLVSRVHIEDSEGEYWPPSGHPKNIPQGFNENVGGDVIIDGRVYGYVESEFEVRVPLGEYRLEVLHGMEYEPSNVDFTVIDGNVPSLEVRLKRWSNLNAMGWYSGDTHTHFLDPSTAMLELKGEDLNVVNILATKWGNFTTNAEHFTGSPDPISEPQRIVYVGEEARHRYLGHTILLNIRELVYPLSWGRPLEGVLGGLDYPTMAAQADKARAQGGFVAWAHFPFPIGEVAVDIAHGKIDSVDLMTFGDAFSEKGPMSGGGGIPIARTWYRFLNCGFRIPITAGTDKMLNLQVTGSVRTYVKVSESFSYEAWLKGIRAGRTFTTTGPMIELYVNGHEIGDVIAVSMGESLTVRARVVSRIPVTQLEIIQGGRIIATAENLDANREVTINMEFDAGESTWIAARAYGTELLPYQASPSLGETGIPLMAHTSPIYIEVDGRETQSSEDAAFLSQWCATSIEWARDTAQFKEEGHREEMIALFESAKKIYDKQTVATVE